MNVWWPHDSVMKVVLTWIMCFLKIFENTYGEEFAIVKEAKKGSIIVVFKNYSNFKGSWTQLPKLKFCPIFKKKSLAKPSSFFPLHKKKSWQDRIFCLVTVWGGFLIHPHQNFSNLLHIVLCTCSFRGFLMIYVMHSFRFGNVG